jgi:dTDP-4-dehydrorhamnose reductase
MKLLISGANGLLGSALIKLAKKCGHTCIALSRECVPISLDAGATVALDAHFDGIDHFVHLAANTDVERCEAEPAICYRDNALLTELLAAAARRRCVAMTFMSSTGVYGSHHNMPWAEYDEVRPTTHHHRSKLLGEQRVMTANRDNLVIRTGWLYGGDALATKNFVVKRIQEARASRDGFLFSNQQQRGCPTNVKDLAVQIMGLIALKAYGVFNAVNTGSASRFEYVAEIIQRLGINVEVRPLAASDFKRVAPVSDNEMAVNWRADSLGLPPMRPWQDALADYLAKNEVKALAS